MITYYTLRLLRVFGTIFLLLSPMACNADNASVSQEIAAQDEVPVQEIGGFRFRFEGGIRFPNEASGVPSLPYTSGAFFIQSVEGEDQIWIAGKAKEFAIAQYQLPEPVASTNLADYPLATQQQPFTAVGPAGLRDDANRVTGIAVSDGRLFVNVAEYYDGQADNLNTTVVAADAFNLGETLGPEFKTITGKAHAAGWITPVPAVFQSLLGGDLVMGNASNYPIARRHSIGPSMYIVNSNDVVTTDPKGTIPALPVIDYPLKTPLHPDQYNESGTNDLWTVVSKAFTGFLHVKSRRYMVVGSSGGHHSGLGYKIDQDNGKRCPGPCAKVHTDYQNYFWQYQMDAALSAPLPSVIEPVAYGELPLFTHGELIYGAYYQPEKQRLYLLLRDADTTQKTALPLLLVYHLAWNGPQPDIKDT